MSEQSRFWDLNAQFTSFAAEQAGLAWPEYPKVLDAFARTLVRHAGGRHGPALRRLAAQESLLNARCRLVGPREFKLAWRRVEARGYSRLQERVLMACLFAQWAGETRQLLRQSEDVLGTARRRVMRLSRKSALRRELLSSLDFNEALLVRATEAQAATGLAQRRRMKKSVRELIVDAAASPDRSLSALAKEIANCLMRHDLSRARPLAYALMGLAVEHALPAGDFTTEVAWLLEDSETNSVIAQRLQAFAVHVGDASLSEAAARRFQELQNVEG